jgi:serine/threonine-protein kinase RsbW/stage II sporulation protein AB (anti-sigma F factor)
MLKPRGGLNESRPAVPGSIATLRRAVVAFAADAGADDLQQENIGLAMSEAVSNSVIHAYPADSVGLVTVQAWAAGGRIVVLVCDDGCGMIPRHDSPGLGLGLPIIARVAERVEIENPAPRSGVRLRMTFPLSSA